MCISIILNIKTVMVKIRSRAPGAERRRHRHLAVTHRTYTSKQQALHTASTVRPPFSKIVEATRSGTEWRKRRGKTQNQHADDDVDQVDDAG